MGKNLLKKIEKVSLLFVSTYEHGKGIEKRKNKGIVTIGMGIAL